MGKKREVHAGHGRAGAAAAHRPLVGSRGIRKSHGARRVLMALVRFPLHLVRLRSLSSALWVFAYEAAEE